MACFSPGRRWVYSYIDQRKGPYLQGVFVVIVVDECFGDFALIGDPCTPIGVTSASRVGSRNTVGGID